MGGIGGMELLVVGLVALIVVGPKDLPGMFRTLGQFTAKARRMGREFTSAMEAAADDAGVSDVTKTLRDATNPKKMGLDAVKKAVDLDLDPNSETGKLADERAAAKEKILAKAAETAKARQAKEAEAAAETAKPKAKTPAKPKAAAKPKTPAKPKATAKPKTAKPKAAAKPKTSAAKPKPKTPRKPRQPKAET